MAGSPDKANQSHLLQRMSFGTPSPPTAQSLRSPQSEGGHWELWEKSLLYGRELPIIADDNIRGLPSWSPDGKRLAYWRYQAFSIEDGRPFVWSTEKRAEEPCPMLPPLFSRWSLTGPPMAKIFSYPNFPPKPIATKFSVARLCHSASLLLGFKSLLLIQISTSGNRTSRLMGSGWLSRHPGKLRPG